MHGKRRIRNKRARASYYSVLRTIFQIDRQESGYQEIFSSFALFANAPEYSVRITLWSTAHSVICSKIAPKHAVNHDN